MILDVGAGDSINTLKGENVIHVDIKKYATLESVGTIYNLPFKDNTFETVNLDNVLEHLKNPLEALKELKRVTKNRIVIKVPNASYYKFKSSDSANEHIFSWNIFSLQTLLKLHFKKVNVLTSNRKNVITRKQKIIYLFLSLMLPKNELTAVCYK